MDEPRKVTGSGGVIRWQGKSGRTFRTYDEAAADSGVEPSEGETRTAMIADARAGVFGYLLPFGLGVANLYLLINGQIHLRNEWLDLLLGIVCIILIGAFFAAASAYRSMRSGNVIGWEKRAEDAWWSYGGWLFKIVAIIIGFILAYAFLTKVTEGLSKGTIIIAFLLLCILIALLGRKSR